MGLTAEVDGYLASRHPASFLAGLKQRLMLSEHEYAASGYGTKYNVELLNSLVFYVGIKVHTSSSCSVTIRERQHCRDYSCWSGTALSFSRLWTSSRPLLVTVVRSSMSASTLTLVKELRGPPQALDQLSARDGQQPVMHQQAADIFQKLATELDTEGRYLFLNALANQLRFPNNHTHYFSCILLYLFDQNAKVSCCCHSGLCSNTSVTAWDAVGCTQLCWHPILFQSWKHQLRSLTIPTRFQTRQLAFSGRVSPAQRGVCSSLFLSLGSTGCTQSRGHPVKLPSPCKSLLQQYH
jgi:hypothetical protein